MSAINKTSCCGVQEFAGLHPKGEDSLKAFCAARYYSATWEDRGYSIDDEYRTKNRNKNMISGAFIIFTDVTLYNRDIELAKIIKKLKLGKLKKETEINPNSKNLLTIWIWKIDEEAVRQWWIKEQARKIIQIT